ncbi:GD12086 [Drosophila simulans]|uniref:GD12086 n=1 Tax=Drosophila simulans TaxID=7240 RepID=B4QKN0_DROSI|nr:GD12086 [Drosophila simulans]
MILRCHKVPEDEPQNPPAAATVFGDIRRFWPRIAIRSSSIFQLAAGGGIHRFPGCGTRLIAGTQSLWFVWHATRHHLPALASSHHWKVLGQPEQAR